MNELISIITPSYNSAKYISETIESVISQTYDNWELLITDDCSTDSTVEIIKDYIIKDNRIKLFILDKNSGAGISRNNSIKEAKGRYIAFLDSDDWWYPEKLQKQMDFIKKNAYEFVFTAFEYCDENLNVIGISRKPKRISYRKLLIGNNIGTPGVIYDTERVGKLYMPDIRKRQDWAMWINIANHTKYAYSINEPLWKYRNVKNSLSSNKLTLISSNIKIYTDYLEYSKFKAYILFFVVYIPNHILKMIRNKIDSIIYVRKIRNIE